MPATPHHLLLLHCWFLRLGKCNIHRNLSNKYSLLFGQQPQGSRKSHQQLNCNIKQSISLALLASSRSNLHVLETYISRNIFDFSTQNHNSSSRISVGYSKPQNDQFIQQLMLLPVRKPNICGVPNIRIKHYPANYTTNSSQQLFQTGWRLRLLTTDCGFASRCNGFIESLSVRKARADTPIDQYTRHETQSIDYTSILLVLSPSL